MTIKPLTERTILVTGGTGFIGSHLSQRLANQGYKLILFDAKPNYHRIDQFVDNVIVVKGDVGARSDFIEILKQYKITDIFHTAARLSVEAEKDIDIAYSSNIEGTFNILDAARIMKVQKVIFLSSLAVFGANTPFPFHETSYRDPGSFYGVSKAFGEMLGLYYHLRHEINFRSVRFSVVIGPGRRGAGATVTYSSFIEKLALGQLGVIDVPENTILPIIYIDDAADFLVALWKAENLRKRIFIAGGVPISIQDLITEVKKHIPGAEIRFELDPTVERVAQTWSFLTTMLVQQGKETLYRDIPEIGWKLQNNSVQEIVKHFIKTVQTRKEIFSAF